ncbi:uracil-DNA glycosylase [Winogradskyella alexanderae]|uniref:Uracil-DNA glycosylase n=1 Tax=Winogradskyella alexanderae TaxID=2877123 RepID=A0ABS7XRZ5_9FLAO|nr:uracil-DNA glycosylase [Winogradskyella alexanderae]MCA0132792.1 uracil-DNA glycosylase [Winogradskyella alexanderae]
MDVKIDQSWRAVLQEEFDKPYFKDLVHFVKSEYAKFTCYPKGSEIFNAFNHCSFQDTKVVIIGQDPYHGPGQANGLCFSVKNGIQHPPSLKNIFLELQNDLNFTYPRNGNLEKWADQGVLLLNATLTVRAHEAGSHQNKGWEIFTDNVISALNTKKENMVFLLWGGYAKKKKKLIDITKNFVLETGHPSPLSANRGYWFGNKHFSKTNSLLRQAGLSAIDWSLK